MQNIAIKVIDRKIKKIKQIPYVVGEIRIDDFVETFDMPIDWWSIEDYEYQWRQGLERLKNHTQSCLVARINNPQKGAFVDWWLLYKEGNKVFVRNELLFRELYDSVVGQNQFAVDTCYDFIRPKKSKFLEDGAEISEWVVEWSE